MSTAEESGPPRGLARRFSGPWTIALGSALALLASTWVPLWARRWGWAPRADFSERFALARAAVGTECPARLLSWAVALAAIGTAIHLTCRGTRSTVAFDRERRAALRALELGLGLLILRALLAWWFPWRTGEDPLQSAHWLAEPSALGAPAPLSWFGWIWLTALWAPRERGGGRGELVGLLAGAWAWWACGLADLGGALLTVALSAPLWMTYRARPA